MREAGEAVCRVNHVGPSGRSTTRLLRRAKSLRCRSCRRRPARANRRTHPRAASAASTGSSSFVADVQTGFGPFIAVYLTSQKWTQTDIGLVLSMSGIIALILQMPGGALVDCGA